MSTNLIKLIYFIALQIQLQTITCKLQNDINEKVIWGSDGDLHHNNDKLPTTGVSILVSC